MLSNRSFQHLNRAITLGLAMFFLMFSLVFSPAPSLAAGGNIVYTLPDNINTLDPAVVTSRILRTALVQFVDTLVVLGNDRQFHPGLATEWDVSECGLFWTFKLRDDVTFHDGTPFNAEAAKYSLERILDPDVRAVLPRGLLGPYETTEVVDEFTIQVKTAEPFPLLLNALSNPGLAMVSPTAVEEMGLHAFGERPVTTGPFMIEEWVRDSHVRFVPNPDYNWAPAIYEHSGPPMLESLTFRIVLEPTTRHGMLETGEAQVARDTPVILLSLWEANPDYVVTAETNPAINFHLWMNVERFPTDDVAVREAMIRATDREAFSNILYAGFSRMPDSPLAINNIGYDPWMEDFFRYDPEEARNLLEQAGWHLGSDGFREKDGNKLEMDLYSLPGSPGEETAELIEALMRDVGMKVNILLRNRDAWYAAMFRGDQNLVFGRLSDIDPGVYRRVLHSSEIADGFNWWRWSDAETDALLDEALTTFDLGDRLALYRRVEEIGMENALFNPLVEEPVIYVYGTNIKGLMFDPLTNVNFYGAWVE